MAAVLDADSCSDVDFTSGSGSVKKTKNTEAKALHKSLFLTFDFAEKALRLWIKAAKMRFSFRGT